MLLYSIILIGKKHKSLSVTTKAMLITVALFFFIPAFAGDRSFNCIVTNVYKLNSSGAIEHDSDLIFPPVKSPFNVDRRSGVIVGEQIPIFRPDKFAVVAEGNHGNAFVVAYSAKTQAGVLKIENYRNSKRVPFILLDGIWASTGLCE